MVIIKHWKWLNAIGPFCEIIGNVIDKNLILIDSMFTNGADYIGRLVTVSVIVTLRAIQLVYKMKMDTWDSTWMTIVN